MVLHFIINNNGTVNEAKDVYQEAIIIFYNKIKNTEFKLESKLKTYIYSICRRLWLNQLKEKNRLGAEISDIEEFTQFEKKEEQTFIEDEKRFDAMSISLEKLGEPCKTILEDFYFRNNSITELTQKMGYNNSDTAKNQKYKCLQRLKKIFFNYYREEN